MITTYESGLLERAEDWSVLRSQLNPDQESACLDGILEAFRNSRGTYFILERGYLDRDFIRAYGAFHHRVHTPHRKHCTRLHVFSRDLTELEDLAPRELAEALEAAARDCYLGFIVLRPLAKSPVSWAVVAMPNREGEPSELLVQSRISVHLLGAELRITGTALTEQDSRTGSCAQAAIWGVARHFHSLHRGPWYSMIDVTSAALSPTDEDMAAMLPAGSRMLTTDAMVRAMKTLGYHPLVYRQDALKNGDQPEAGMDEPTDARPEPEPDWYEPAHRIVGRYLDSGIPVIIGLNSPRGRHAVVAVGAAGHRLPPEPEPEAQPTDPADDGGVLPEHHLGPNSWDYATHFLVNDDQAGPYRRLAIRADDLVEEGYRHSLEDATFIMPVLPETVWMHAAGAETVARRILAFMSESRREVEPDGGAPDDPDLEFFSEEVHLVARTYLTQGWKHVRRALRNDVPDELKEAMNRLGLPKYVWVTEFSLRDDVAPANPASRRVRAHVVVDPTSSHLLDVVESALIANIPGYFLVVEHDQDRPGTPPLIKLQATVEPPMRYSPKRRGEAGGTPIPAAGEGELGHRAAGEDV